MKIFVVIRGMPGSGKSTLARELASKIKKAVEVCADSWPGRYEDGYKPAENPLAQAWCLVEAENYARDDVPAIFVHNTFVKREHIKPYATLAKKNHYMFFVIQAEGDYTNEHNVPYSVMKKMDQGWENWETRS